DGLAVHLAQSAGRAAHGATHRGVIYGKDRGTGDCRADLLPTAPPVYAGPAGGGAIAHAARGERDACPRKRESAQPGPSPVRLPFPHALPDRRRAMYRGSAGPATDRGPRGRGLPSCNVTLRSLREASPSSDPAP